ncbi:DUF333 domain-containing protein [Komagataeibacter sp. FNDCR2]|uniref:putative hemolysin n=1 Tax=Komagataeibacter sp. FNDCR2 TaxID=2878682 RepID=UPI001E4D1A64|nr:DUF333 domain-containing protein [Komagataeibacter sp. FNDCR2]MCE2574364.1 DUF333 domain-containing protein [Komagataeibacter sp. FNDCR2]
MTPFPFLPRAYACVLCVMAFMACLLSGVIGLAPAHAVAPIGTPNPASKFCVQRGGRVEMLRTGSGVTGWCHLPSGKLVEEWKLFRRNHPAMRRR